MGSVVNTQSSIILLPWHALVARRILPIIIRMERYFDWFRVFLPVKSGWNINTDDSTQPLGSDPSNPGSLAARIAILNWVFKNSELQTNPDLSPDLQSVLVSKLGNVFIILQSSPFRPLVTKYQKWENVRLTHTSFCCVLPQVTKKLWKGSHQFQLSFE